MAVNSSSVDQRIANRLVAESGSVWMCVATRHCTIAGGWQPVTA